MPETLADLTLRLSQEISASTPGRRASSPKPSESGTKHFPG